jgi:hypothetical protein
MATSIIKGLSIVQFGFVILVIIAVDFGLAWLVYLLLKRAKVTARGATIWIVSVVFLTVLRVASFEYILYLNRNRTYSGPGLSWAYVLALPEVLFSDLTGASVFNFYAERPSFFWPVYIAAVTIFNLIILLPALQVGMRRKLMEQVV